MSASSRNHRSMNSAMVAVVGSTCVPPATLAMILAASASACFLFPCNVTQFVTRLPLPGTSYLKRQLFLPRRVRCPLILFLPSDLHRTVVRRSSISSLHPSPIRGTAGLDRFPPSQAAAAVPRSRSPPQGGRPRRGPEKRP